MKKLATTLIILFSLSGLTAQAEESSTGESAQQTLSSTQEETKTSNEIQLSENRSTLEEDKAAGDEIKAVFDEGLFTNVTTGDKLYYGDDQSYLLGMSYVNRTKGYLELNNSMYQFRSGWEFVNITFKGEIYQPGDRIYDESFKTIDFPYWSDANNTGVRINYKPTEDFYVGISYVINTPTSRVWLSGEQINSLGLPTKIGPFPGQTTLEIPEAPTIPGYVSEGYAEVFLSPFYSGIRFGDRYTFINGTLRTAMTYIYKPDSSLEGAPITIHHIDIDGNKITDDSILTGMNGDSFSTHAAEIDGYSLVEVTGKEKGYFDLTPKEVTYTYEKVEVIPPYIDYQANTVVSVSPLEKTLKIIQNYNVSLRSFKDGNTMITGAGTSQSLGLLNKVVTTNKKIQTANGNVYYTVIDGGNEYILLSTAFIELAPITVHYLDNFGNKLTDDLVLTGKYEESYSTQSKEFSGYRLVEVTGNEQGTFTFEPHEVTYKYEKVEVIPPYIDYQDNTIISISDLERDLEIVKNYNVYLMSLKDGNTLITNAGTNQSLNILNKRVTTSKRIQTANGNIYYSIIEGDKEYVILSTAFKSVNNIFEDDLSLYSDISLDYNGNYLTSFNDVSQKVTLVNNYNVYDLLQTGGDGLINPNAGTSSSLNLMNQSFDVTREYTTSGGSKFYNIVVDGYNYFINAAAFVVESIQSWFE